MGQGVAPSRVGPQGQPRGRTAGARRDRTGTQPAHPGVQRAPPHAPQLGDQAPRPGDRGLLVEIDSVETLRSLQDDSEGSAEQFSTWTSDYHWLSGRLLRDGANGEERPRPCLRHHRTHARPVLARHAGTRAHTTRFEEPGSQEPPRAAGRHRGSPTAAHESGDSRTASGALLLERAPGPGVAGGRRAASDRPRVSSTKMRRRQRSPICVHCSRRFVPTRRCSRFRSASGKHSRRNLAAAPGCSC